jgi:hypothetical protein
MVNKPVVLFAATTVIFAATSAYLARALLAERALRPSESLVQPDALAVRQEAVSAVAADGEEPSGSTISLDSKTASAPVVKVPATVKNRTYSAARLAELKLQLQDEYPDLVAALGLLPDEAAGFFDLLARQKVREQDSMKPSKESDSGDWQKQRELNRQADRAEQAAYLGAARASEWNRYQETLASRDEVRELRMQLADSDYPLRRDQYEALIAVLGDEQIRHTGERERLHGDQRYAGNPTPAHVIEYFDKRLRLIEESLARRGRAAASVLDSEQLRRYQAMLEHERMRAQAEYESFVTLNAEAARNSK